MSEKSSCVVSLLATPISDTLGAAREELVTSPPGPLTLSLKDFIHQLRQATTHGDSEHVHKLLRSSRHHQIDFSAHPPLICLAASKGYTDIVGLFIRHGADVNVRMLDDSTALICAADNGFLNVLALLLNAGAMMNLLNKSGETALARATRRGWVQCARLLLNHGANPHPMATDGHPLVVSPLHLARQMHQSAIEKDILVRAVSMENILLQTVKATVPKHIYLLEPGHLVDTKTSSFFPVQLLSEEEISRFVLYFKTPPGYDQAEWDLGHRSKVSGSSDELILVYIVRAQLSDGQVTAWLNGPGFTHLWLTFNGSRSCCTRMPGSTDYPGLCVFSVSCSIKTGGLNTLYLEAKSDVVRPTDTGLQHTCGSPSPMVLIGAYRVRIDVMSLIQTSAGLAFGGSTQPTIYIPRTTN